MVNCYCCPQLKVVLQVVDKRFAAEVPSLVFGLQLVPLLLKKMKVALLPLLKLESLSLGSSLTVRLLVSVVAMD